MAAGTATPAPLDPTFRSYSSAQAETYAQHRPSYPADLYSFILKYHADTSGQFTQLLDVGCGPGIAVRDLAASFEHATGYDPGQEMIAAAKRIGGKTGSGEAIEWRSGPAEECSSAAGIGAGGVDLLTAATAAHWFDMPKFWREAARLVKSGGTVAIWTSSHYFVHPDTPGAAEIQRVADEFEKKYLLPYFIRGNVVARNWYEELGLPWEGDADENVKEAFPPHQFKRIKWNWDGALDGPDGKDFFGGSHTATLQQLGGRVGTAGPVTRWREAHPETAGTDDDCVTKYLADLKRAAGGSESLTFGKGFVLLIFKRT